MVKKIANIFLSDFGQWGKVEYFRTILYAFLILNTLSLLPIAHEIWAYDGIVGSRGWNTNEGLNGSYGVLNVLSHPANHTYSWVYIFFIIGQLIFLTTGILRILPKLSSILIYFFTVNLFLKGYLLFTGGEVLVNLILFYLMFIQRSDVSPKGTVFKFNRHIKSKPQFTFFQNILNNTFYWAILIQICFLYFFTTLYKLYDESWLDGSAIMYVSRIPAFSSTFFESLFGENKGLSMVATYVTLLYQGLFPVLVWIKKIKFPFLILGTIFHLSIAFGMGIFTFGILMVISYMMFLDIDQLEKIRYTFSRNKKG